MLKSGEREDRVFSVVSAPKSAAPKFVLAGSPTVAGFSRFRDAGWDREFQHYLALGNKKWFFPRGEGVPLQIFFYRENGGVPFEAVAVGAIGRIERRFTSGGMKAMSVRRPFRADPPKPTACNMNPAILTIPVVDAGDRRDRGLRGILQRNVDHGIAGKFAETAKFLGRLSAALRRTVSP